MPASTPEPAVRFRGVVYRALNPVWSRAPLSGEGARRFGGRFNAVGTPALYTSTTPMGAVREANQIGSAFEPVTLVAFDADVGPVLDATDAAALALRRIDGAALASDDWRIRVRETGSSYGQRTAAGLIAAGYAGMLVGSFARGAPPDAVNLVLWRWGADLPARLVVMDREGRLTRPPE